MLRAVVLRLRRRAGPPLPVARSYDLAYSWLCQRLAGYEAASGLRLHGSGWIGASPLLDPERPAVAAGGGGRAALRITLLDAALAEAWQEEIAPALVGELIPLGRTTFEVEHVVDHPAEHPLAATWTPRDVEAWAEDRPATPLWLQFLTPTSVVEPVALPGGQRADRPILLPEPARLVDNLGRRWNALFPDRALPADTLDEIGRLASVVRIESLRTHAIPFRGGAVVGFVGTVAFASLTRDPGAWMLLAQVLRFGTLAGVGRKTAFGFGLATLSGESALARR